ncbi:MAG: leucine-rich repeat protein, partial [Clostridia bacterium]
VENTYIVASYSGTAITVEIPSTHNGMQVTKIKDNAFSRNAEVISIKLPDTIISIGTYAFSNCPLLNSINIPVSVKNIDAYAYSNCASLTGIIIPKNVSTIKQGVFENCIALTIYTEVYNKYDGWDANWNSSCPYVFACLDNELANDGWTYRIIDSVRYAFKGSNAKVVRQSSSISNDITILSQIRGKGNDICTVTSIDEQAFKGCSRIRSIIIPNSVTDIGADAFYGCASLATATINNGSPLSIIRSDLFQNCYALESIFIPKGVTDISEFAFFGCKSLKSIVFEAGSQLVVVQRYAFSQCENLANFVLPTSVEYIEEQAFSGCKSITEIFIPISTLHIGNSAFARCINLLKIDVDINNPNYTCGGANDVLYSRDLTKILQYALGRKNEMYTVNTWVRSVCEGAFESSQFLKRVIITENVTSIGARAFKHCEKLERVNFDQGCKALTDIGQNAFEFCIALKDITLPSNLKSISDGLLFNCELLKTVVIPTSVTSIGYYSFEDCRMLGNIELSKNIVSIGGYAFSKCYSLTKINIPLNVITIGAYTVVYADALSKPSTWDINWKGSNTAVCWDAKNNDVATNGKIYLLVDGLMYYINGEFAVVASKQAVSVEVVNILSAVTYKGKSYPITKIDDYAFYCCKLIKNCIIPRNITEIGYGAFNGCAADICIVVPKEVTKCEYAFPGSNNATVFYEGTLNSFGCNMINNCVLDETKSYVVSFTKKQSGIYISQITPIREGYVFAGWFDNAEFTGESIADLIKVVVGVDVYAKWQKKA